MNEDIIVKRPDDPTKINVNQKSELAYWSKKYGVTEDRIIEAIELVGNWLVDVKRYLGK